MHARSCTLTHTDHLATLRRLTTVRWIIIGATLPLVLALPDWLDIPLPRLPLLAILGLTACLNGLMAWRLRQTEPASGLEVLSQICFDLLSLSALLFFSGGATNPLVSLLLPPVAIAALTLPARCVALTGLLAIGAYSLLMVFYLPLPLADAARATRLHLLGMWITFAASAMLIGGFVVRMTALIRQRDAQLAAAREQAMRDERVVALGALAAGAAHELGTPLATMAVITGELERDPELPPALREDLQVLRQQIAACKDIITHLSRRAGAERLEAVEWQALDQWLEGLRRRWQSLRPAASSRLQFSNAGPPPQILADPTLEQAVLNLLNNAANVDPGCIELNAGWDAQALWIEIRDHGPGFSAAQLRLAGKEAFPAHAAGSGIGLLLTDSAAERLGGQLELGNHPQGGAQARLTLPRDRIRD